MGSTPAPLRPREQWILAALAEAPLHGYGLLERVESLSAGAVRPGPATLYRTLNSLSERALIEVAAVESQGDRTRTIWRITRHGRTTLTAEVERLRTTTERIRQALESAGS